MGRPDGTRGFALLASLWLIVVVGLLLVDLGLRARPGRIAAANAVSELRARAAAEAGIQHALARLHKLQVESEGMDAVAGARRWNELPRRLADLSSVRLPDGSGYGVRVEEEGTALPLNRASGAELRRLFDAVGVGFRQADLVAQSILDWRDPDGLHRARGAEWDDHYRHLSPAVRPRNGPFQSLDELRWVRGVTREVFDRVAPFVTVHGDGRVNVNVAPRPVLQALPGMTRETVGLIENRRRVAPLRNLFELEAALSPEARAVLLREFAALSARTSFAPRQVRIVSTGHVPGSPLRVGLEALAARESGGVRLVWRRER